MDYKKIGKYIKEKRMKKGLTQFQLAELLNLTDKAISKWETGTALPDISLFPELSKILGVSYEELHNGEDKKIEPIEKKKNYFMLISISLIILLIIALISSIIYFKSNYSKVNIYKLESEKNTFDVDGTLIEIDDKVYFTINKVEVNTNEFDKEKDIKDFSYEVYFGDDLLVEVGDEQFDNFTLKSSLNSINFTYNDNFSINIDDKIKILFKYTDDYNNTIVDRITLKIKK